MCTLNNTGRMLLFILLFLAVFVNQELCSQILIGPKAGLSLGVFSIANQASDASNSLRIGFLFGSAIEARISDMFSIQIEPAYNQKGALISFNDGETKIRFGYVQIPLTLKVRFENQPITPYLFVGPNVGFLLSAKAESNLNSPMHIEYIEYDEKPNSKETDVAIDFGAGCEYNMSTSLILTADVRYSLGIYDIDKTSRGAVKTRCIQILIGTLIPL
jgi:hypothetical protein